MVNFAVLVVAGCTSGARDVELVGEAPIECEAPPVAGTDDVDPDATPMATLIARLPVIDPDCAAPTALVQDMTGFVTWSDAGIRHDELVAAEQRSRWSRIGDTCRVRIAIAYGGGPAGRAGAVTPCDAHMLAATWASFAGVAVIVDAIAIDGEPAAAAWPAGWTDGVDPAAPCARSATIARSALGLELDVELSIELADWRRLHSTAPPMLAIRAAITLP